MSFQWGRVVFLAFLMELVLALIAVPLFLSGAGCDPDFGVSGANLEETMVNRAMLRIAREVILVSDSTKFSKRSMSRIAAFSEIDIVISDTGLREEMQEKVRGMGCNLILA